MRLSSNPKLYIALSLLFFVCLAIGLGLSKKAENIPNNFTVQEKPKNTPMLPLITDSVPHLKKLFKAAMLDAQNPEPSEIYNHLINLETDKNLLDTIINRERYIKMVSWKLNPKWYPKKGKFNNENRVIWVTAAPIIQDSCKSFHKKYKDPNMRLRQLLGLQPFTVETFFLEVWVKPSDLFRPAPDNETNDSSCGLNLPNDVSSSYRKWFNDTRANQYKDCTDSIFDEYGYPWTQLGYTYDWSPDNPTNVGLSEFVIKENSNMYVSGGYPNKVYCTSK
ncbi:hypothetical protein [Psychroserpens sp. SPM9]|uniref:hypothetical protein n=1 Tax=Psychroserpens sp. SPM9 TaxID=2975598 RepID=UPI0021A6B3AE|nr:hypothetical protein [Psychroserpens sp. SPM9]MDG5490315.1 hypothetical protein [Psychroserpens sp. SPM9]